MKCYIFDTSALLTLRDNESGAEQVADILYQAQNGEIKVLVCFISLMEMFYRVWKDEGEQDGRLSLADAWIAATAILEGATLVHKNPEFDSLQCRQMTLPYKEKS